MKAWSSLYVPLYLHLILKNFSIPMSAPNPASVTTLKRNIYENNYTEKLGLFILQDTPISSSLLPFEVIPS